ncbi:kinetochore protein NDC80 homolog [Odontomachus brunneus]|uniref:kinetochore protein NDC80 homolog n=1 Tax=Odontomachus brunneus TaxID=486640 RepID=UPI0013F214B6|nr:kinetochore protein NDC80 homolog [Odontomachus brunneus]
MNSTRNDRRKTQTLKPKRVSTGETSHIPRLRVRSSSSDRASGRISYLKVPGKTPLHQPTTPVALLATPVRVSIKSNVPNTVASCSGRVRGLSTGRSPSGERANNVGPKDTRPLADKSYQAMLLTKIDDFFRLDQRSNMLNSNGSLKPITLKMFVEVSNYLLKFFEIKQEFTASNYVEELPRTAKKLRYPGVMTKSWLKTANAMHSWPSVLGWIGWLVEIRQVQKLALDRFQMETLPFVGTKQQAQNSRTEFLALLECYKAWNDEKLDEEKELLEKYLRDIETQWGISEEDVTLAHKELEEETRKLQMMEEESRKVDEEVERLQTILSTSEAKESKLLNDIRIKEEYIKKMTTETDQMMVEHETLNEQIRQANKQHKELVSIVKDQPMSKVEKEKIMKQCTEIQNYIHGFDEHLNEYQKELYTLDIKLASINNNLNKMVLTYNKEIFMYIDSDINVNFNELKLPEKGLLDPHVMEVLEEKIVLMKTLKESLKKQCNDVILLIHSDTIKLENLQEKIKSVPNDEKLHEEKSHIDKIKMNVKNEKIKLMEQIETRKNEIKEIQDVMPDVEAVQLEIEEAKDKLEAVVRRMRFLEQSGKQFFDELYQIVGEHRNKLYNLLTKNSV